MGRAAGVRVAFGLLAVQFSRGPSIDLDPSIAKSPSRGKSAISQFALYRRHVCATEPWPQPIQHARSRAAPETVSTSTTTQPQREHEERQRASPTDPTITEINDSHHELRTSDSGR